MKNIITKFRKEQLSCLLNGSRLLSLILSVFFLANVSSAQVTINFESLGAGTISTNPYSDPSGYKFTGLNSAGANELLSVSTVHSTKSIINTNWSSQVVLEKTDGAAFNLTSFSYHGDPWDGTADATVTGTYFAGGTVTSSYTAGANFATLTLNWSSLKKVVINFNGGTNAAYGLLDNFVVSSGTTTTYTLNTTATNGSVAKSPNQASYTSGTNVTLTATANSGYTFSGWSGDASGTTNPLTVTMNANKNITANFTASPATYTVNVTATNGSVSKSPNQASYNSGTNVTLTATANSGYTFSSWSSDASGATNPLTITVNANKNITANFIGASPANYTLNVTATNGSVAKSPNQALYNSGTNVTLTATANSGYTFSGWSGDVSGTTNPLSISMTANKNITANFTSGSTTKYEAESATLSGTSVASSSSGYSGTGYATGLDATNDKITFTVNIATAGSYPLVIRFMNSCGACDKAQDISINGAAKVYTSFVGTSTTWIDLNYGNVSLNAGNNTIAIIKSWGYTDIDYITVGGTPPATYTLNTSATNGSVAKSPNQTSYASGSTVTLTATANSGYSFSSWSGDASGSINPLTVTMNVNKNITANFTQNPVNSFTLNVTATNGSVSKSPNQATYASGTNVRLTATANSGYTFSGWSGNASGSNNPLDVTMNANKNITANFTANGGGGSGLLDPNATPATVNLWNYLKSINGSKMLTGAWTEYQYGGNAEAVRCTGKMPAIWGNDMNTWYNSRTDPMWNQVWAENIDGFKTAYNRGQILQVNWHWQGPQYLNNGVYAMAPNGGGMGAWSHLTAQQWNDIVTPGTSLYNTMIEDIDYHVTGFLKKLVDNEGNPMPLIFRPLHEIDGGWFWWTCASDPAKTATLFKILQNRIINYHGVHNLIWVYNPGVICDGGSWPPYATSEYPRRQAFYPGDAYCDITGIDLYDFDPIHRGYYNTSPAKTYRDAWNVMKAIAPTKMTALCEAEVIPDAAKCFNDPTYAPWLYCLPWYAKETDQCAWNNIQFNSPYVINAGDFTQFKSVEAIVKPAAIASTINVNGLKVYPNPARDVVNLKLDLESTSILVSVFDINGKEVLKSLVSSIGKGLFQINSTNLSNGLYLININNGTINISGKVYIQK